jgi:catechol 2,3-dioxygenase
MTISEPSAFPNLSLSHFEIYVDNVAKMEEFYTRCLGFIVTDRGDGENGMVFMSKNPSEHHQVVLSPGRKPNTRESPMDHISFRLDSIANLRIFYNALKQQSTSLQTVSHGNTWSIYFRDPEDNRLEIFTDTPWHVSQPCRFEIDLQLSDDLLIEFTRQQIQNLPGYAIRSEDQ